ncbi:hypothetical protein HDU87_008593 [Geranomyces variabilis]|uniref:Uncharacterized protein n=1 Tax=Geranomyces variabilis TaxID=109894 RepID=A0AAD5TPM6_9FUNG|nr:hypothetical protein HDU87_008593 [Geranomyces variabilis]
MSLTDDSSSPPPQPTDLPSCFDLIAALEFSLGNATQALIDLQLSNDEDAVTIFWILSLLIEALLMILLLDRIAGLPHKPTKHTFILAVTTSILFELLMVLGSTVPFFFDVTGTYVYYWAAGPLAALSQWSIMHLLYLRVSDALSRIAGRRVALLCLVLTALVFPLELAKQWYAAVKWSIDQTEDPNMYLEWLNWLTAAYRFALDLGFNSYSFFIIYGSGVASHRPHHQRTRRMDEHTAFIIGYIARSVLFVASDVLFTANYVTSDAEQLTFSTLTVWGCSQLLRPIKPYLICTDMARIRVLSADTTATTSPSADGTKVQSTAAAAAAGGGSSHAGGGRDMSTTKLRTARMDGEEGILDAC